MWEDLKSNSPNVALKAIIFEIRAAKNMQDIKDIPWLRSASIFPGSHSMAFLSLLHWLVALVSGNRIIRLHPFVIFNLRK